jgi:hypothetical protein
MTQKAVLAKQCGEPQLLVTFTFDPTNEPGTAAQVPAEAAKILDARKKRELYDHFHALACA